MKFRSEKIGQTLLLDLDGALDSEGSAPFEERCLYEQQEGSLHFVIALGAVQRISGPGLRVLVGLARSLPRSGGSLVLCELDRKIEEALQVSGLDGVFERRPDRAAALRRSQELQAAGNRPQRAGRAASEEKIAYAIELLGAGEPAG